MDNDKSMHCKDCEHFNRIFGGGWLMNKLECALNIQRELDSSVITYEPCDSFSQCSSTCVDGCTGCKFNDNSENKCVVFKYPCKIFKYYGKCNRFTLHKPGEKLYSVECRDVCSDDGCKCFVKTDNLVELCKAQRICSSKKGFSTYIPNEIKANTIEQMLKSVISNDSNDIKSTK